MIGLAPLAAVALAALWTPSAPAVTTLQPSQIAAGEAVWLAEIGVAPPGAPTPAPPPAGILAGLPLAAPAMPAEPAADATEIYVSDRGWIGEPGDSTHANVPFPPRLIEPPAIEAALPILPEGARRAALTFGELRLANGDGALDSLAGDWSLGGRSIRLLRGAHRRPIHADRAEFVAVALLRAAGAASGTTRLSIALIDAAADLTVPACDLYGGTGGSDGEASLAGDPKPRLYGIKRQIEPVIEDTARGIYRISHSTISAVLAVRDRGAAYSFGTNRANYAALQATAPAAGAYDTCLAEGCIRVEPAGAAGVKLLTVDARGDATGAGYSAGTPASIANKLLLGPGGLSAAAIADDAFSDWPVGEAGLYLRGGTVAEAMEQLAAGVAGWWGADRDGLITGARIAAPEGLAPLWDIQPWMLRAPPEEVDSYAAPPRWRARVGYQVLGRVMTGGDIADSVSAADREAWGKPYLTATEFDADIAADFPLAFDPPVLPSVLDAESDAAALALTLFDLHSLPRRTWRVPLNRAGIALALGQPVRLTWPRHGLAAGRVLLVRGLSLRGDRTEALLWG